MQVEFEFVSQLLTETVLVLQLTDLGLKGTQLFIGITLDQIVLLDNESQFVVERGQVGVTSFQFQSQLLEMLGLGLELEKQLTLLLLVEVMRKGG